MVLSKSFDARTLVFVAGRALAFAWAGAMMALGAIVAPLVFRNVPSPFAADAMTLVFRRMDRVSIAVVILLGICEVVAQAPFSRRVITRQIVLLLLACSVFAIALYVSPEIARLHTLGAIRYAGPLGTRLEQFHVAAETLSKTSFFLGLGWAVLFFPQPGDARR